jgi:hypothetical protein
MPKFYLVDQNSQIYFELCEFIKKGNKLVPGCLVPVSRAALSQWNTHVIEVDFPKVEERPTINASNFMDHIGKL